MPRKFDEQVRAAGALPRWLVWLSYIVGIGEFVNVTIARPTVYVFPAWIALVSIVLLIRRPSHGLGLGLDSPAP